jgi:hypothetical protein
MFPRGVDVHVGVALLPWLDVVVRAPAAPGAWLPVFGSFPVQRTQQHGRPLFLPATRRGSGAPAFSFPSEPADEQRAWKTPMGVVSLVSNPPPASSPFEPAPRGPEGKAP